MAAIKYVVGLSDEERDQLVGITRRRNLPARKRRRAQILLKAHEGCETRQIAEALGVGIATVCHVRKRFVEEGLEGALKERPRPGGPVRIGGKARANIIALAVSAPPEGHARWSLRLLASKAVEMEIVDSLSHERVRQILQKIHPSLGGRGEGALKRECT
jgi:transposase